MAPIQLNEDPSVKEQIVFYLKSLIELVENDRVRVDQIRNLTPDQVIELAEAEAQKAVDNTRNLAGGN